MRGSGPVHKMSFHRGLRREAFLCPSLAVGVPDRDKKGPTIRQALINSDSRAPHLLVDQYSGADSRDVRKIQMAEKIWLCATKLKMNSMIACAISVKYNTGISALSA